MQEGRLAQVVPIGVAIPIKVRFIRKWQPRGRNTDTYYFLIDEHGDAIQASVHWLDKDNYDKKISLMSCYILDKYICGEQPVAPRVCPHPASIRMGSKAVLTPVPTPENFPMYCFYSCPYADLPARARGDQEYLTDFMAKLEGSTPGTTKDGRQYLRLHLKDISGNKIDATLWEEALPYCDRHAMLNAEEPIITALTSLRVGTYFDKLQPNSTMATYTYFNPQTIAAIALRSRFQEQPQPIIQPGAPQGPQVVHATAEERSRRTISELLQQNIEQNRGKTFICSASIVSYSKGKPWYHTSCPECPRKMFETPTGWSCGTHEDLQEPKFAYVAFTKIADNTDATTATVFDEALTAMVGKSYKDMVVLEGYTDRFQIPKPLYDIMGDTHLMHVQYTKTTSSTGNILVVNKVSKENMPSTPAESLRIPGIATKVTEAAPTSQAKRQLSFENPGPVSDTKKTRYPE